jgi:TrmH family RNA methyltransferase
MGDTVANKKIKEVRALCERSSARRKTGLFVVEGERIFREIPKDRIETVYISEDYHRDHPKVKADHILDNDQFRKLSDTRNPQGILAVVRQKRYDLNDILGGDLYLILETIQDPGNLGTMIRTAEAAGASGVIMNRECADIYSPKTARSTMGAIFRVPYMYTDDLPSAAALMKEEGITVYAAHLEGRDITGKKPAARRGYMIGNEGSGLSDDLAALANERIRIPMDDRAESLNAAVSAAILMYWGRI